MNNILQNDMWKNVAFQFFLFDLKKLFLRSKQFWTIARLSD